MWLCGFESNFCISQPSDKLQICETLKNLLYSAEGSYIVSHVTISWGVVGKQGGPPAQKEDLEFSRLWKFTFKDKKRWKWYLLQNCIAHRFFHFSERQARKEIFEYDNSCNELCCSLFRLSEYSEIVEFAYCTLFTWEALFIWFIDHPIFIIFAICKQHGYLIPVIGIRS